MAPGRNRDADHPPETINKHEAAPGDADDGTVRVPFESIPLPYQIVDDEGRIRAVNDAWLELLGYEKAETERKEFSSILTSDSQSKFESLLTGSDTLSREDASELEIRCADDSLVAVSVVCRVEGSDSENQRIHCQFYEITQHRQRKHRLRRFKQAIEATGHAVYLTDGEGEIEYVNPGFEELTGYTEEDAVGSTPAILNSGEMSDQYYETLWQTITAGDRWEEEITNRCKDGSLYDAHQTISPVTTDEGEITGFVAVQADITDRKRRQRELVKSRERLRVLFEESPDAVTIHDSDGDVIGVNGQSVEMLGYSREELLSMNVTDFEVGHEREELLSFWEDAGFQEQHAIEGVHRRKDGTTFPVEVWINKIEFSGETQFIALSRDITERKARERELERKEFLFERVQEIADIGIWEYHPGDDKLWWSEGVYEIYDVDESFEPTFENAVEFYHPDDRDIIQESIEQAVETGEWYDHNIRLCRADGETRHTRARGELTRTEEGEQVLRGIFQDVTAQQERERTLERYERLVENLPLGVYRNTSGSDGWFTLVNEGMVEMFDAESKAHLREQPVSSLYVDPSARKQFSDRLAAEGVVKNEELELETLTGERIWGSVTAVVTQTDGEVVFDGAIQDISERKAYEQTLKDQRDNLDILNQVLRHDIRNDLQLVLTYTELLEDHTDEEGKEYLQTVQTSAFNAVALTQTARDLAEVMLQSDIENESIKLAPVISNEQEEAQTSYPDATVSVEGSLPNVSVTGNEMLGSVFRNLLKNAVQHNDNENPAATVSVTKREPDDVIEVRVADNGPGVPDEQKAKIFGKGEKGLHSDGTGIGLYLVQSLVDTYGGSVSVEDNEPRGTVFVVELPVADSDDLWGE